MAAMHDTSSQPSFGRRLGRAFRNFVLFALFVGFAGAAAYALSVLNSRTYMLEVQGGQLVVLKGKMLPMGADPWLPADPRLADAYAPLDLEGNTSLAVVGAKYADRDELDRALFVVIELLAKPRVASDSPRDLERGLYFVRRGERLNGLTEEQKLTLKRLQAEVSFYLARTRLEDAQKQVEEALGQLRIAAQSETRNARAANQMLLAVEPPAKVLSDSLRNAVHQLSEPPPAAPPTPSPAPLVPAPVGQGLDGSAP